MALLIGVLLALAVGTLATYVGLDRDRGFYPTVSLRIDSGLSKSAHVCVQKGTDTQSLGMYFFHSM